MQERKGENITWKRELTLIKSYLWVQMFRQLKQELNGMLQRCSFVSQVKIDQGTSREIRDDIASCTRVSLLFLPLQLNGKFTFIGKALSDSVSK